nr:glycogen debranching protein GlgX [Brachybacterium equifaecis]
MHVDARGRGVIAVAAPRAERIELCVLSEGAESRRTLRHVQGGLHWDEVEGMVPGTLYGLRAHGPWDPASGHRFNPAKVLLDPYARGVSHASPLLSGMFGHEVTAMLDPVGDAPQRSESDNADLAVWSQVTLDGFDWQGDASPRTAWEASSIYELHVKGFTQLHPVLPAELRGTYAGLGHPAVTGYLRDLGVTTVELLPIHAMMDEPHLTSLGLTNYWGYSTLSFFAPNPSYATAAAQHAGAQAVLDEVKEMVRALHAAGIEVILDVVYNHTAEGGHGGPTLSFRGLDNITYYWMDGGAFVDVTGTGGTFDPRSLPVMDLILASLRFWVQEVHIDGFRFDLAATLGRDDHGYRRDHPLLRAIITDPVLRGVKLIAEPWDVGGGGWQTGGFPAPFAEWNDAFRDTVRSHWLSDRAHRIRTGDDGVGGVRDLASRLAGSRDVLGARDPVGLPAGRSLRAPWASVNYITAHDGFTLEDLVTYDHKHNEANGEGNRDGTDGNRSWNHGHEGPVPDGAPGAEEIRALRERSARSLLATLILAAGTPLITAGDEFGRTQQGNNNAYCQDNEISWVDWSLAHAPAGRARIEAVRTLLALRARFAQLRPSHYLVPVDPAAPAPGQVAWFGAEGSPLEHEEWQDPRRHVLQMALPGTGQGAGGEHLVVVLSSRREDMEIHRPSAPWLRGAARVLFDSSGRREPGARVPEALDLPAGSVLVLAVFPAPTAARDATATPPGVTEPIQ